MELEKQDNINMLFSESKEDFQAIQINTHKKNKNSLKYMCLSLILFIINSLLFLHFYKKKSNKNIKLSQLNEKIPKEKHIDSGYKRVCPNDEKYIYIPIVGTSDFHGRFFPEENEINLNSVNIKYKTGGLEYISKYINILREEFGKNRVLYFDVGDQFFHTNETILFNGQNIIEFLNKIGLNGTTLGNHEFIYRRDFIEKKIEKAN